MQITKKRLIRVTVAALIATLGIRLITVFSIQDIYSCSTPDCSALSQADTKISIGITLQYVSLAIFAVAMIMLLYLWIAKKERF